MRIRMTDERERRLRQAMEVTGENTKAGAIDAALKHLLTDVENKHAVIDRLDQRDAEILSTPWVELDVSIERAVRTAGDEE